MKFIKAVLPALLAAAMTVSAVPANTFAMTIDTNISQTEIYAASQNRFSTVEAAGRYMRECINKRQGTIELSLPSDLDFQEAFYSVMREAFAETYSGKDGDYIRTGLKKYSCKGGYDSGYIVMTYTMQYRTNASQEQYVDKRVKEILGSLNLDGKSEYNKVKAIYEYIIKNVDYDYGGSDDVVFTAYGALKNGKAVCQGFAHLFYRLTKEAGLSSRMIKGDAGGGHAWNIVAVNGIYYLCDSTWDIFYSKVADCNYFMKGTNDFDDHDTSKPHVADSDDESKSPYNVNFNSKAFKAMYPISKTAYNTSKPAVGYSIGDVNKDGSVDSVDASLILGAYSRIQTGRISGLSAAQELAADTTGDGRIDSVDASAVLAYYSHLQTGGKTSPKDFFKK